MSLDTWIVFGVLAATIALFVSDRIRLDVVALMAALALMLAGVVTPEEGVAGFANPIVLMIAGLFVVGGALAKTGVADWLGRFIARVAGTGEVRLLVVVMGVTALLSAFMSSTGTVAILLPVVVTVAQRAGSSPSRLLMPMAFASLLGGMLTLIGTPPNIVVSNQLRDRGLEPFHFFSFTAPGLVLLALGIGFMAMIGRKLLPRGDAPPPSTTAGASSVSMGDIAVDYGLTDHLQALRVRKTSPLVGQTLREANLRARFKVNVVGIHACRPDGRLEPHRVVPAITFNAGDLLRVQGAPEAVAELRRVFELDEERCPSDVPLAGDESLAEVVVPRRSQLVGRTLRDLRFRDRYRATVLAVRRAGSAEPMDDVEGIRDHPLRAGDTLLLKGRIKYLRNLRDEQRDFAMVTEPRDPEEVSIEGPRAIAALAITGGMLVLMTFALVPNVVAVMLAAVAMVLAGCIGANDAYRGINWESVVLIAGILPLATALEKSGGIGLIVDALVGFLGGYGPYVLLAVLFVLTSAFSQVVSNTATAVLLAPVAFRVATDMGLAPHAFLMAVALAASTSFATPIASPVNTLVLNAGGYRFGDYFKVGVTLQLVLLLATMIIVPLLFPF